MLENRMIAEKYIENNIDHEEYLEYLLEKDDQNYDDEIWEEINKGEK